MDRWVGVCGSPILFAILLTGCFVEETADVGTVIRIDLGTTCSCVSADINDRSEIIPDHQGNRIPPSLVASTDNERSIGEASKKQAASNPEGTIFDADRLIGRRFDDPEVQREVKVKDCETRTISPEEISAMTKMKETTEAFLGKAMKDAVIAVPDPPCLDLTPLAFHIVQLKVDGPKTKLIAKIGDEKFNLFMKTSEGERSRFDDPNEVPPRGIHIKIKFTDDTETPPAHGFFGLKLTFHDNIKIPPALREETQIAHRIGTDASGSFILKAEDVRSSNWVTITITNGKARFSSGNSRIEAEGFAVREEIPGMRIHYLDRKDRIKLRDDLIRLFSIKFTGKDIEEVERTWHDEL